MSDSNKGSELPPTKATGLGIDQLLKMLALQMQSGGMPDDEEKPKPMEEYKFWNTQPVRGFDETVDKEGPVDPEKTVADVDPNPVPLHSSFEWSTLDLTNKDAIQELYDLLYQNYIEDTDETLRFQYTPQLLEWALKPPGWVADWHIGVRVKATGKLVAFISGVPQTLRVRTNDPFPIVDINFLVVHKKLRSKRLAPVLIKEVTRRVNLTGVWQALYTAGKVLPSPVSTARYYHRPLNWVKLSETGFSSTLPGQTPAQMVARNALPKEQTLASIRPMQEKDVQQVFTLLTKYLQRYELAPVFKSEEEISHFFVGAKNTLFEVEEAQKPVFAYVIEDENTGKITDFFSFFRLDSTVLNNPKHDSINAAYGYYYATETAFPDEKLEVSSEQQRKALAGRLKLLHQNALILARNLGFDVFNAVSALDNPLFLEDLKFGVGTGALHYYLFNYKAFPIHGGFDSKNGLSQSKEGGGIGVLLL